MKYGAKTSHLWQVSPTEPFVRKCVACGKKLTDIVVTRWMIDHEKRTGEALSMQEAVKRKFSKGCRAK